MFNIIFYNDNNLYIKFFHFFNMKAIKISLLLIISILIVLGIPTIGNAQIPRPEAIYPFGHYDTAGDANAVHVSGNIAYVVDSSDGLLSINIQDPANPTLLDKISTTGYPKDIFIIGNIAYVATNLGLELFDITNPKNLTQLGSYALLTGEGENVLVDDHVAFLAAQTAGIKIIDVSNPKNLTEITTINTIGDAYGVEIQGDILFAASWDYGFRIYNISDLTNPQLISQNPTT